MRSVTMLHSDGSTHAIEAFLALPSAPAKETAKRLPAVVRRSDTPFERAKDVPIADVVEWLGYRTHKEGDALYSACPAHGGHNEHQMIVGGDRGNVAHCFGDCGRTYTTVDLVMAARGVDKFEAVHALSERFGFEGFPAAPTSPAATAVLKPVQPEFRFLSVDELCAPLQPVNYVIKALDICPGRPSSIVAPGFGAKTISAQSMLISVATGLPVWGEFACRKGTGVYLDYEMGKRASLRRLRRLSIGMNVDWQADVAPHILFAPLPPLYFNSAGVADALKRAVDGATLVVVDSLRRALPGEDENDSALAEYVDIMNRVSEDTGATFEFIHHATTKIDKKQKRDVRGAGRGSSAIFDSCGSVLNFSGEPGEPVKVIQTKAPESGVACDTFYLVVEDVPLGIDPKAGVRVRYMCQEEAAASAGNDKSLDAMCNRALEFISSETRAGRAVAGKGAVAAGAQMKNASAAVAVETLLVRGQIVDRPEGRSPRLWAV